MRTLFHTIRNIALAAPALFLASCFEKGGYTNVVVPGTVFVLDTLPGDTLYFDYKQASKIVPITTNQRDWTFSVVSGRDFCSARKSGGISVSVSENELMQPRAAEITLKGGDETRRIVVYQNQGTPFFRLSTSQVAFDSIVGNGVDVSVTVTSNFQWSYASEPATPNWLNYDVPETKSLRSAFAITCYKDNPDTARTAVVTFTAADTIYRSFIGTQSITITQKGK
jgi:hypothetical protein